MKRQHFVFTIIFATALCSATGMAQDAGQLKPLTTQEPSKSNVVTHDSYDDTKNKTSNSDTNATPPSATQQSKMGYAIAVATDFGSGLHEQADVRNSFDAGGAVGLEAQMRFVQLKHLQFGFNLGLMHFAHSPENGTPNIRVATKLNRFTSLATVEFFTRAFFVNGQLGAGFMIISVESELIQNGVSSVSNNAGLNPGPMAGLEIGMEMGEHFFKWHREFRFGLHSDWMRHDQRDEITILMQLSIQLFSTFK